MTVSRKLITLEYLEGYREWYEDALGVFDAKCKCCERKLETGDFIDGHYPYHDEYNVCQRCEPTYETWMADEDWT